MGSGVAESFMVRQPWATARAGRPKVATNWRRDKCFRGLVMAGWRSANSGCRWLADDAARPPALSNNIAGPWPVGGIVERRDFPGQGWRGPRRSFGTRLFRTRWLRLEGSWIA